MALESGLPLSTYNLHFIFSGTTQETQEKATSETQ